MAKSRISPLLGIGVAAGATIAGLAPFAAKRAVHAVKERADGNPLGEAASKLGEAPSKVGEAASKLGEAPSKLGDAVPKLGGGGDDGGDGGSDDAPGTGKGRRMPIQQSVDVAAPIAAVYDRFTRFEDWPQFMHRVTRVSQDDDCNVSMTAKIWAVSREFTAAIQTQRPDDRIKWDVEEGIQHTGVVSFHELAPRLTRVNVTLDVDPGSLLEKFARGARHVKRAVRGDLHRFKAFAELQEDEPDGWRGTIEDGKVVRRREPSGSSRRRASPNGAGARGGQGGGRSRQGGGRSRQGAARSRGGGQRQSANRRGR
jgi:uncharacterized membrane protein